MSQQGHWKASALAATFSASGGFSGTAWGAARAPHMSGEIGFGMGFGVAAAQGGSHAAPEAEARRQKRKASSEDDESMGSSSPTPEPAGRKTRRMADGLRRSRAADAAAPNEVALDKLLEPLEEKSLRQLLDTLVAQNPQLAAQVRQLVPKPTVTSACSQLERLERRLQAAFPYNKSGPSADDYTYHRVRPALEELRDTIVMYLDHFTHYGLAGSQPPVPNALPHPAEWFDLLTHATDVAVRMPKWDRPENNAIRRETLRLLADGWLRAIMATARWTAEGHIVGRDMLSQWALQLDRLSAGAADPALFRPAAHAFQRSFGHRTAHAPPRVPLETTT